MLIITRRPGESVFIGEDKFRYVEKIVSGRGKSVIFSFNGKPIGLSNGQRRHFDGYSIEIEIKNGAQVRIKIFAPRSVHVLREELDYEGPHPNPHGAQRG